MQASIFSKQASEHIPPSSSGTCARTSSSLFLFFFPLRRLRFPVREGYGVDDDPSFFDCHPLRDLFTFADEQDSEARLAPPRPNQSLFVCRADHRRREWPFWGLGSRLLSPLFLFWLPFWASSGPQGRERLASGLRERRTKSRVSARKGKGKGSTVRISHLRLLYLDQ